MLLFRLTGAPWPSVFVAALFAWHPLHVESVAWIAERKDVLSAFLDAGTAGLRAYVQRPEIRSQKLGGGWSLLRLPVSDSISGFYWLAFWCFALGLMSKPMLVTLPFVLLLLDYWPLQRFSFSAFRFPLFLRLALEKWPFFLLAAASCTVTFLAQHTEAVLSLAKYPLNLRLGNTLLSYVCIWEKPSAGQSRRYLSVAKPIALGGVPVAIIFLIVITWLVWKLRRSCPYLLVGWLWFLGTLVPVIGLVQTGCPGNGSSLHLRSADWHIPRRYFFVPGIGRCICGCDPVASAVAGGLILAGCFSGATEHQLSYWKDDETLFSHTLAVTKNNDVACVNLGVTFEKQGFQAKALAQYQEALRINSRQCSGA